MRREDQNDIDLLLVQRKKLKIFEKPCDILQVSLSIYSESTMGLPKAERGMAMTDHELRALMSSSLNEGAKALYRQYAQYIYAIIFRILREYGTQEDVEDCFADTFAEIIQHYKGIQGEHLKSYIGQAARNRALNYAQSLYQQRMRFVPLESVPEPAAETTQAITEQRERDRILLQKIKALGEPDATIIVQKYYFRRKMSEIARMVGLSPHAAQARCGRALKKLRRELEDWR